MPSFEDIEKGILSGSYKTSTTPKKGRAVSKSWEEIESGLGSESSPQLSATSAVSSLPDFVPAEPIAPEPKKKQSWFSSLFSSAKPTTVTQAASRTPGYEAYQAAAKSGIVPGLYDTGPQRDIIQPISVGFGKTVGQSFGALEEFNKKVVLNPFGRFLDRVVGVTPTDTYGEKDKNVGDQLTDWIDHADTKLREATGQEKDYLDQVLEGVGSSLPFLMGGAVASLGTVGKTQKAIQTANLMLNLGMSGTEAMINTYDDYKTLKQNGEKTGSSGGKTNENANLVGNDGKKNYFTNKEGKVIQSAYQRIFIKHKK